ncbi:MAG: isocitrate/isopropylmalate family dehydrogenase, partial [Candidatus Kapaibacterium sp.]
MSKVVYIPGDGIGPDIAAAVRRVVDVSGAGIEWIDAEAGLATFSRKGTPLPAETIELIRQHRVALKGPLTTPVGSGFRSVNVALRKEFDLYINLRPVKWFPGVKSRFADIDLVIFRENTEGLYSGVEHYIDSRKSAAESVAIVTRYGSERIVRAAFDYARKHGRKKVTIVHKANILK